MRRCILTLLAVVVAVFAVEAQKAPKPVKLLVEVEQTALTKLDVQFGQLAEGDIVKVNNKECVVQRNKKGILYVDAEKVADESYKAGYPADVASLLGGAPYIHLVPAQHFADKAYGRLYMPMAADEAVEGKLVFKPLCGVLRFKVAGDAVLNCIKLEGCRENYLAGHFDLNFATGLHRREKSNTAVNSVILDCSNDGNGVQIDKSGKDFYVVLPVGNYDKGLKVTITDRAHHTMVGEIKPFVIKRGEVSSVATINYAPDADQLFSEKFDNMVYGGDYQQGKYFEGFVSTVDNNANLTGVERAVRKIDYNTPGTGYLQRKWKTAPLDDGAISAAYLQNRNIADYESLLRAQEFFGYLGVGVQDKNRGIFTTPSFSNIEGISDIEITFKIASEQRCNSDFGICVVNAGVVKEFWVNGVRHTLTSENYPFSNSQTEKVWLRKRALSVGSAFADDEKKPWFEVRLVVSGATNETALSIVPQKKGEKDINGFYIDDIEVRQLNSVQRKDILRVMDYNIQNGMWADQHNNYDNFVKYMIETDVDIAIFCEASSIYYDFTNKHAKREERYLPYKYQPYEKKQTDHLVPTGWIELAARYGHPYVAIGAHQDNYPVVVTSKYPIVKSVKLGGEDVSHGGIHAQVEVDGEIVNIVAFHTWPHGWKFGVKDKEERAESKLNYGGHITRYDETKLFCERTILNSEYADQKHWIIAGDMNCYSPLDDSTFDLGYDNLRYAAQRYIVECVPQVKDLIKFYNSPDKRDVVIPSAMRGGRIDYMYGSDKFVKTLIRAKSPKQGFTNCKFDKETRFFKECGSDHLPIICDFKWR